MTATIGGAPICPAGAAGPPFMLTIVPKPKGNEPEEIETLVREGKTSIAAGRQMKVQLEQGRVAVWTLRVGVAILILTVVLIGLTIVLIVRAR
jgi:hypothetical protein